MKKICLSLLICSLFLISGCGNGSETSRPPENKSSSNTSAGNESSSPPTSSTSANTSQPKAAPQDQPLNSITPARQSSPKPAAPTTKAVSNSKSVGNPSPCVIMRECDEETTPPNQKPSKSKSGKTTPPNQ